MSISIQPSGRTTPAPVEQVAPRVQLPNQDARGTQAEVPAVKAFDPAKMQQELREALERLNDQMRKQGRSLSFSMDEQLNQTIIQVKDSNTGQVVRQIPNEAAVRSARSIEDLKGLLLNEKT